MTLTVPSPAAVRVAPVLAQTVAYPSPVNLGSDCGFRAAQVRSDHHRRRTPHDLADTRLGRRGEGSEPAAHAEVADQADQGPAQVGQEGAAREARPLRGARLEGGEEEAVRRRLRP